MGRHRRANDMDHEARQLFQELPEPLKVRGWTNSRQESTIHRLPGVEWYTVVFLRPFEPGVDDEDSPSVVRSNRKHFVRVSTDRLRSPSWDQAFRDAIELMHKSDQPRPDLGTSMNPAS